MFYSSGATGICQRENGGASLPGGKIGLRELPHAESELAWRTRGI
jgi:hypothetical protein